MSLLIIFLALYLQNPYISLRYFPYYHNLNYTFFLFMWLCSKGILSVSMNKIDFRFHI